MFDVCPAPELNRSKKTRLNCSAVASLRKKVPKVNPQRDPSRAGRERQNIHVKQPDQVGSSKPKFQ